MDGTKQQNYIDFINIKWMVQKNRIILILFIITKLPPREPASPLFSPSSVPLASKSSENSRSSALKIYKKKVQCNMLIYRVLVATKKWSQSDIVTRKLKKQKTKTKNMTAASHSSHWIVVLLTFM